MASDAEATPAAAVRGLLRELAAAPDAEAAAARLARAAHPRFLGKVGGERHLARLLSNSAYAPLVGHAESRVATPEAIGDAARVAFTVDGPGGAVTPYLLSMVRVRPSDGSAADGGAGAASGAAAVRDGDGAPWRVTGLVRRELEHL